jgi:hypothetical protein
MIDDELRLRRGTASHDAMCQDAIGRVADARGPRGPNLAGSKPPRRRSEVAPPNPTRGHRAGHDSAIRRPPVWRAAIPSAAIALLVGCMPTREEVWDPRDYELSCDELRAAIGAAVDEDLEARRVRALGYGSAVVGPAAAIVAAPAAVVAAPAVLAGAAVAGTYAILKGTEGKQEAERRRAHLERIFFAKGCVAGAEAPPAEEPAGDRPPTQD